MPTAHEFPNLTPSQRSYTPGTFPQKEFQGLNGAVTVLQYGVQSVDSTLEMTFNNITDAEAYSIFENYESVNSGLDDEGRQDYVLLPRTQEGAMAGVQDQDLLFQMAERGQGPKLRYRYAQPPTITSTFPGRCTVQVSLRGYLEGADSF